MVGGETKRIAESLEQLRVRLIVGYMRWALSLSRALSLSHSSFCLATKDGFSPFAKGESTLSSRFLLYQVFWISSKCGVSFLSHVGLV